MNTKKKVLISLAFAGLIFCISYLTNTKAENAFFVSLGDAFVMLAACFLPTGWAMLAALLGSGVSAFLLGGWQALIAITLFRVLAACWFMDDEEKLLTSRTAIGAVMSFVLFSVGPYLFNMLLTEDFVTPLPSLYVAALGAVANVALFFILVFIVDKFKLKNKLK